MVGCSLGGGNFGFSLVVEDVKDIFKRTGARIVIIRGFLLLFLSGFRNYRGPRVKVQFRISVRNSVLVFGNIVVVS